MFIIPIGTVVLAVIYCITNYFLARPKLKDQDIMSDAEYAWGVLIEVCLITIVEVLSFVIGMALYNDIAAKYTDKLAAIPDYLMWIVVVITALGAIPSAVVVIRQVNKLKRGSIQTFG